MTSSQPPKVPLEYQGDAPPPSGWRVVRQLALGVGAGGLAAGLVVVLVATMFPNASRAEVGRGANYLVFGGLGMGACGIGALVWRKWFWGGMLGGCGVVCAGYGFLIGLMSSITC